MESLDELEGEAKWVNIDSFARLFAWSHNSVGALIWSLVLPISMGVTLFLVIGSVQQYNAHGVSSTIRYHIENDSFPFPTFLLCCVNPFNSNFSWNLLELANVTMSTDDEKEDDLNLYWRMFMQIESYLISTRGYPMTLEEKFQLTVYSNASFDTVLASGEQHSVTLFTHQQIFHPKYFNCLVYNMAGNVKAAQIYDNFSFVTYISTRLKMFASRFQGFYLFLHNQSDFLLGEERSPLLLSYQHYYDFYFSRKFYNQYPAPYSSCGVRDDLSLAAELADRFLFDQVIQVTGTYSQKSCFLFCTQLLTNKLCDCQSNRIAYNMTGATYCSMQQELTCARSVANYASSENVSALFDEQCRPNCPLECSRMLFKVKTMNTPVGVYDILVYSHISDMAFVELVEEPLMNGWSLLGTLGGHFHLLLGMSLASFLELGQFILIAVSRSFSKYKRAGSTRILNPVRVQETLLKTGYIPSAVRSSNKLASILWTGMFLSSAGVCIFLIRQTALDFLSNRVTSSVSRRGDMSTTGSGSAIRTFF